MPGLSLRQGRLLWMSVLGFRFAYTNLENSWIRDKNHDISVLNVASVSGHSMVKAVAGCLVFSRSQWALFAVETSFASLVCAQYLKTRSR